MNKHLTAYIAQRNKLEALFGGFPSLSKQPTRHYVANALTVEDKRELLDMIENDLSPENLTCDGELRGAQLARRAAMLNGAKAALEAL